MPKTVFAIVENTDAKVTGVILENGLLISLPEEKQIPRAQLAQAARALAIEYGVTLPENPAIPPE